MFWVWSFYLHCTSFQLSPLLCSKAIKYISTDNLCVAPFEPTSSSYQFLCVREKYTLWSCENAADFVSIIEINIIAIHFIQSSEERTCHSLGINETFQTLPSFSIIWFQGIESLRRTEKHTVLSCKWLIILIHIYLQPKQQAFTTEKPRECRGVQRGRRRSHAEGIHVNVQMFWDTTKRLNEVFLNWEREEEFGREKQKIAGRSRPVLG